MIGVYLNQKQSEYKGGYVDKPFHRDTSLV